MWRFTTCFTGTGRKNPQTRPQSKKARASCRSHSRLVFGIPQRSPLFVLFLSYSFSVRNKGYLILYHRFRMGLPAVVLFILKRFCTYHLAQLVFVDRHGPSRFAVMNTLCRVHGLGKSKLQTRLLLSHVSDAPCHLRREHGKCCLPQISFICYYFTNIKIEGVWNFYSLSYIGNGLTYHFSFKVYSLIKGFWSLWGVSGSKQERPSGVLISCPKP